jgi:hypothetical protein
MSDNTPEISNGYSLGNSMSLGWQILKNNYWPLVWLCFATILIMGLGSVIASLVPLGDVVFSILVTTPLSVGLGFWVVLASRGEKPPMSKLFAAFSDKYVSVVSISFITVLIFYSIFFGAIFVGGLIGGLSVAVIYGASEQAQSGNFEELALGAIFVPVICGIIIGAILGLFVYVRFTWAALIALDPEEKATGIGECIGRCWRMTARSWFSLFFLMLFLSIIMMLSFLLLCVGYFFLGLPLYAAASTGAYILLREHS